MTKSLTNQHLTVTVKQAGAELCGIKSSSGVEYIWQADSRIWPRHAPVLFPIVGKLAGDSYTYGGKRYEMKQHGFARDMEFTLAEETGTSLSYRLLPSPETRQRYPFEFELWIRYILEGNALEIVYEVSNNGGEEMPFSIGGHPGFALNWGKDDRIEDYFLEFEKTETLDARLLGKNNLLSSETERLLDNGKILRLRRDLFDKDALILLDLKSRKTTLRSYRHGNRLTVEFPGFPYLGIWAKPGAPFVCIEPWHGHADTEEHDGDIMNKPGIIRLKPNESFRCAHRIVVEE